MSDRLTITGNVTTAGQSDGKVKSWALGAVPKH